MINTNTTFSPEAIGRKFSAGWPPGLSIQEMASWAAINMASAGCTLQSLFADETQAEAVMTGWPAADAAIRFGLTQAEADTVFDIFGPIITSLDCRYSWRRQGDTVVMRFTR